MTEVAMVKCQGRVTWLQQSIAEGRDLLALLRDPVVVLLFLLLLRVPQFIGDLLARVGFEKGEIMGFTWTKAGATEAQDLIQNLGDAQAQLRLQARQLQLTQQALSPLREQVASPMQAQRIERLQIENARLLTSSTAASRQIATTLARTRPAMCEARKVIGDTSRWSVLGGDVSLEAAQYEVRIARQRGIEDVAIYRRQGSYRMVAVLDDRAEAERALAIARERRPDAYIVNFDTWCPRATAAAGFSQCS